jgi:uncharacterized protein YkuJ
MIKTKNSEIDLVKIVKRIQSMTSDFSSTIQERRFNLFGLELVKVIFNHQTDLFQVISRNNSRSYSFDDYELVAIEVFEILNETDLTF